VEQGNNNSDYLSQVLISESDMKLSGPHQGSLDDLSFKLVEKKNSLKIAEQPLSIAKLAKMTEDQIINDYFKLHEVTVSEKHSQRNVPYNDNQYQNRYSDILAYDHTRVKLTTGRKGDEIADGYINANHIDSPLKQGDGRIIASQGPLSTTVKHFWRMCVEQNVSLIVTTCRLREGKRLKCEKFWPSGCSSTD